MKTQTLDQSGPMAEEGFLNVDKSALLENKRKLTFASMRRAINSGMEWVAESWLRVGFVAGVGAHAAISIADMFTSY
jgi:hypothetical protein